MNTPSAVPLPAKLGIDQISTRWSVIIDPAQFALRYAPAIQRYLLALLKNRHDAEDVAQEFFVKVLRRGFAPEQIVRSRFRNYLKTAVRNAALTHLRRLRAGRVGSLHDCQPAFSDASLRQADQEWLAQWRECLLRRTWRALERQQRRAPGNRYHLALSLAMQHPQDDSPALAARLAARTGNPCSAEAFRQQLSRARRKFAELLVREVAQTLESPTLALVEEELVELQLLKYVRAFLPADWRTRGILRSRD